MFFAQASYRERRACNPEFFAGSGAGGGINGKFNFYPRGGSTAGGILNFDNLTTVDKTFTFPDATGTIALTSNITGINSGTNTGDQNLSGYAPLISPSFTTPTLGVASATSLSITGTAGAGFLTLVAQSANPTSPVAGTLLVHSSTANGFTRMEQDNEATTNLIYGRDSVFVAKNTTAGTISKGQVVYVTGSTGNVPNIGLAQANSSATLPSLAIAVDNILANAFGQIMTIGIISMFDTSAFTTGAPVWVSTTVAGGLTATRPSGTTNSVQRVGSILV